MTGDGFGVDADGVIGVPVAGGAADDADAVLNVAWAPAPGSLRSRTFARRDAAASSRVNYLL